MSLIGSLLKGGYATVAHGNPYYYQDQAEKDKANSIAYASGPSESQFNVAQQAFTAQPQQPSPQGAGGGGGGYSIGSGVGASGGGGSALTPYLNNIYGDQNQINSLYDSVNGQIGTYGQDKRNQIDQNYMTQFGANDKNFANANNTTIGAFQGRGLSDSSLLGNAQDQNKQQYTTSNQQLQQSQQNDLAQLGGTLNGAKQQLGDKPIYDLSQYKDVNSLNSLHQQLGEYINGLKGAQNNLLTSGQLQGKLNSIAPAKSSLGDTLKATLDKLVGGGADPASQYAIAQTYISQLPKDQQDQWLQYFNNAQKNLNAPAAVA